MMWHRIRCAIRLLGGTMAYTRVAFDLLGVGAPMSVPELLALSVLVGFFAGDELGTRGTIEVLAQRDFDRERDAR